MKKYLITENQNTFLRRVRILKDLLDVGIYNIIESEGNNLCDWNYYDIKEELVWQIYDNVNEYDFGNMTTDHIHNLIKEYFIDDIEKALDDIQDLLCKDKSKYEDDDDYYSSLLYGVDNNQ